MIGHDVIDDALSLDFPLGVEIGSSRPTSSDVPISSGAAPTAADDRVVRWGMGFYKVEVVQRRWYTVEVEADSESEAESIALASQSDWEDGEHETVEEVEEITKLGEHGLTQ